MKKIYAVALVMFLLAAFNLLINCSRDKSSINGPGPNPTPSDSLVDYKPAIYIYPESALELNVKLSFPTGGRITVSEPTYPDKGWNVVAKPGGLIDDTWPYLFYECILPNIVQCDSGWCVDKENLESFFLTILKEYGLNQQETNDFLEYWLPALKDEDYKIFPQPTEIMDQLIDLSITPAPVNLLRLHFLFQKDDHQITTDLTTPSIQPISRKGYTVIEWGGMLYQ